MKPYRLIRYFIELAIVTLMVTIAAWITFTSLFPAKYPAILPVYLLLVVVITAAGQVFLSKTLVPGKDARFNTWYMAYKAIKMLLILAFLLIYLAGHGENGIPFLISAFIIYLVYMIFEARSLNRALRNRAS